jgi:hypothetical protein
VISSETWCVSTYVKSQPGYDDDRFTKVTDSTVAGADESATVFALDHIQERMSDTSRDEPRPVRLENLEMSERTGIILLSFSSPMLSPLTALFATLSSVLRSRSVRQLENLALRHQIGVLQRAAGKRLKLRPGDRLL